MENPPSKDFLAKTLDESDKFSPHGFFSDQSSGNENLKTIVPWYTGHAVMKPENTETKFTRALIQG